MQSSHTTILAPTLNADCTQFSMKRWISIGLSRIIRITLLFAYISFPMWSSWLANFLGYRDVASHDLLIAMAWMPIGSSIVSLSFIRFGWKNPVKGILSFLFFNALLITCAFTWIKF